VSGAHVRQELGGYVLGALEPDEHEAVAAHLAGCPECAAELARIGGLPALLAHADGLEIPAAPAAIEERVLDRIAQERGTTPGGLRRPRLARLPGWARGRTLIAGALAGAALGAGVTAIVLTGEEESAPSAAYSFALRGDGGASARAELAPGDSGTEMHLWVEGLPPGEDMVYEVLCERPGWSASAGTFRADARGRAYAVLTTAARIGEYESVRVVRRTDDTAVLTGRVN
jgi:anti-sigma factor RsiW